MKEMNRLKEIIERWLYDGKAPRGMTPYMLDVLIGIYADLSHGQASEFITKEVYELLERYCIPVAPAGIGWIAYPATR